MTQVPQRGKVKVKVDVDLYSALSWSHL